MDTIQVSIDSPNNDNIDPTFITRQYYEHDETTCIHLKFYYNESTDLFTIKCNTWFSIFVNQYKFKKLCQNNNIKDTVIPKTFIQSIKINNVITNDQIWQVSLKYSFFESQYNLVRYDGILEIIFNVDDRLEIVWHKLDHTYYHEFYGKKHMVDPINKAMSDPDSSAILDNIKKTAHDKGDKNKQELDGKISKCYSLLVFISDDTIRPVLFDGFKIYEPFDTQFTRMNQWSINPDGSKDPINLIIKNLVELMKIDTYKILRGTYGISVSHMPQNIIHLSYEMIDHQFGVRAQFNMVDGKYI